MSTTLLWFRRDLRVHDHAVLQYASRLQQPMLAVFVWHELSHANPRQQHFIAQSLTQLKRDLAQLRVPLRIISGSPEAVLPELAQQYAASDLVCAEEYTPAAIERDNRTGAALMQIGCQMHSVCDHVILPKSMVMTKQGQPYAVYTPYRKAWLSRFADLYRGSGIDDETTHANIRQCQQHLPSSLQVAFDANDPLPVTSANHALIDTGGSDSAQEKWQDFQQIWHDYAILRDFPARRATSHLSAHLRFGTLSLRQLAQTAAAEQHEGSSTWLNELIWRDFFHQFFYHYPEALTEGHHRQYGRLPWPNKADHLQAWQTGQTGYPLIDAAMRCLNQTGFMHNRLRMVCASFLCKDLLCDWRYGEAWFAQQLTDYDCAANVGGWQWAASCGCDAQPYFRHFNPVTQSQKFDPDGRFIRRYLPELAHLDKTAIHTPWLWAHDTNTHGYPEPIVQHSQQRQAALALYRGETGLQAALDG